MLVSYDVHSRRIDRQASRWYGVVDKVISEWMRNTDFFFFLSERTSYCMWKIAKNKA